MSFFKKLLTGNKEKLAQMIQDGAVIVDVRSPGEFQSGHVQGSKNIPLPEIDKKLVEISKWNKPVILCCASGMRSGQATSKLKKFGVEAENGGGWAKVNQLMA